MSDDAAPTAEGESIPSSVDPNAPTTRPEDDGHGDPRRQNGTHTDNKAGFVGALRSLEDQLIDAAVQADRNGAPVVHNQFVVWAHNVYLIRVDFDSQADAVLTLADYLETRPEKGV